MSSTRYALAFAPVIVALATGFALFQLWTAVLAFRIGNWQFGLFYLVFGIGGIALALALWRVRQRFRKQLDDQHPPEDGPASRR